MRVRQGITVAYECAVTGNKLRWAANIEGLSFASAS